MALAALPVLGRPDGRLRNREAVAARRFRSRRGRGDRGAGRLAQQPGVSAQHLGRAPVPPGVEQRPGLRLLGLRTEDLEPRAQRGPGRDGRRFRRLGQERGRHDAADAEPYLRLRHERQAVLPDSVPDRTGRAARNLRAVRHAAWRAQPVRWQIQHPGLAVQPRKRGPQRSDQGRAPEAPGMHHQLLPGEHLGGRAQLPA